MNRIKYRGLKILNLDQYQYINEEELVGKFDMEEPEEEVYVLRMLIQSPTKGFQLPEELNWCLPIITASIEYQTWLGIRHPFMYLTIRKGICKSIKDDEWHVDGFSMKYPHIPEQNYIYASDYPTQVVRDFRVKFPQEFDPLNHNIHSYLSKFINPTDITNLKSHHLYCMDPYVIHRRPPTSKGKIRTFIRVSFTPLEINDINNTINPLIPTNYTFDGVKFRDSLKEF
jgi:hypothetical protein